jgi:hypothetical protein
VSAWVLVFVIMLATFTGIILSLIFGSAENTWTTPEIALPRHDPMAVDSPPFRHEHEQWLKSPT